MERADRIALLRESELFRSVPEHLLRALEARLVEVMLREGATLFEQGEAGDAVYLVLEGLLALEVDGVTLLTRRPGECVGEFALIDDEPRSTAAVARSNVLLLRWERADFQSTLNRDPVVAHGIFKMLTGKLREDVESTVRLEREKERWVQDLARAREIQMGMLPIDHLTRSGIELSGYCSPAAEVGGDYYDYVHLSGDKFGVIIGDVTGHGFYAGLFVAMAKACLHTLATFSYSPRRVMSALRRTLDLSIQRRLLMTSCYVLIDPVQQRLRYANAGHPYPYLLRAGEPDLVRLEALDPLLGALDPESSQFMERQLTWSPGDLLVLYSDGVTEARKPGQEMFDHERLEAVIRREGHRSALEVRDAILAAVNEHVGDAPWSDDITLVVVKASALEDEAPAARGATP